MTNDKEQQFDEKQQLKERKKRKRGKRAHGTGSIFRRPERKGKQWVAHEGRHAAVVVVAHRAS